MLDVGVPVLVATIASLLASIKLAKILLNRPKGTAFNGPPSNGFLLGRSLDIYKLTPNRGAMFEEWAKAWGAVYRVPVILGSSLVVICDSKALGRLYAKDTYTYVFPAVRKRIHTATFGPSKLILDGEEHKSWRRKLQPSFSPTAIRGVASVCYDAAYKLKTQWDTYFESATEVTIDVQDWASRLTLDVIGISGFGHDFKALERYPSPVMNVLENFGRHEDDLLSKLTIFICAVFPMFLKFPTNRARLIEQYQKAVSQTAKEIILREQEKRKLSGTGLDVKDKSILNAIMSERSADGDTEFGLDEMIANNLFIIAGFEATITSITWALIELARNADMQQRLREELQKYPDSDPNWDRLKNELRYLDAVVQETLRLHPSVELSMRVAVEDDTLPLTNPITTASGEVVDSVTIEKGTTVLTPHIYFNTSEEFWGPDSKKFKPERWLSEITVPAKENHGYRYIYTFGDGPRFCLGKDFAFAELKTTLSVLIRNYTFELPDGPGTVFGYHKVFALRPKPVGKSGAVTPMRVRQVEVARL